MHTDDIKQFTENEKELEVLKQDIRMEYGIKKVPW